MSTAPIAQGPVECRVMQRDPVLEELSDKVRNGEPIGFLEALAVIDYQDRLRVEREAVRSKTLLGRLRRWLRAA